MGQDIRILQFLHFMQCRGHVIRPSAEPDLAGAGVQYGKTGPGVPVSRLAHASGIDENPMPVLYDVWHVGVAGHVNVGLYPLDQFRGLFQASRTGHQFGDTETAFDTQLAVVHLFVVRRQAADDTTVFRQQIDLTTDTAEGAGGGDFLIRRTLPRSGFFAQGADRAHRHAGAAEFTPGFEVGEFKRRSDDGTSAPLFESKHVGQPDFLLGVAATIPPAA